MTAIQSSESVLEAYCRQEDGGVRAPYPELVWLTFGLSGSGFPAASLVCTSGVAEPRVAGRWGFQNFNAMDDGMYMYRIREPYKPETRNS